MIKKLFAISVAIGFFSISQGAFGSPVDSDRVEQCRAQLIQAQQLDVLFDLQWPNARGTPRVVVGRTYFNLRHDAREGFAQTVNCFLVGGRDRCVNFPLIDQRNAVVGNWENCRLK